MEKFEVGFTMIRSEKQRARCVNTGIYGSPLYCDCGCQIPIEEDTNYNIEGLTVEYRVTDNYIDKNNYKLVRNNTVVGFVTPGTKYLCLDNSEYLGISETSDLYQFIIDAKELIQNDRKFETTEAGNTIEETALFERTIEKIEIQEIDNENKNNFGYCMKCHSYCYGDCD